MNPAIYIRPASPDDLPGMLEIYRPFVENTTITFEYEPPTQQSFRQRYNALMPVFPWLVCEYDGVLAGYAYAAKHQERAAYQWDAELSIYVRPDYQKKRIGISLYRCLLRVLTLQGYLYAHALVTLPNDRSIRLHKRLGFQSVGLCEKTGFKHGKWRDVAELRLKLAELPETPTPPEPFHTLAPQSVVSIFREEAAQIVFP